MRRMSFSATVPQMRAGTKTVTRRDPGTWTQLQPGDRLLAVEKAMGLPKGARQVPIGVIEIVSNTIVRMSSIAHPGEAELEGFANFSEFHLAWIGLHGRHFDPSDPVRRIEFRHIREET